MLNSTLGEIKDRFVFKANFFEEKKRSFISPFQVDNDYECIMTLQHPKHPFPAIYWCSGQFRPLWKKSIFCQKITIFRIFGHFSHDLTSQKWPETAIPHENTFSESQTYFYILRKSISIMEINFFKIQKIAIFHEICIFCDILKIISEKSIFFSIF